MNKPIALRCFFLILAAFLSVQRNVVSETAVSGTVEVKDSYYYITADGGSADAALLIKELEARYASYNRLFRFDPAGQDAPLRVRSIQEKGAYDAYVSSFLGKTVEGSVYLHYADPGRRELVINRGSGAEKTTLPYQAFIQYLRAFIPNPPDWIREGFGVYFNTLRFNPETGNVEFEENLAWLDTVKGLGAKAPSLESILRASGGSDSSGADRVFQPAAWALVSFFMNNGNEEYFRTLSELFMALSPTASAGENAETLFRRITRWNNMDTLRKDYEAYLASRKSYAELIRDGQKAYAEKRAADAESCFSRARDIRPAGYLPYYYLGLLAYDKKDYAAAEKYYRSAGEYGAEAALVSYVQGLNSAAWGHTTDAIAYLETAAAANPQRYRNKASDLMKRLK
ncbi:MAG: hypothetical protein LBG76_02595 [Treponema sp.]|nr:hypothetical protein [Treponema sp.]